MRPFSRALPLIFGGLLISTSAAAETYVVMIEDHPASGNCHELARDLGARFAQLSGITDARAICANTDQNGHDVRITYERDSPDSPVRIVTLDGNSAALDEDGWFRTQEACDEALPGERDHFANATNLETLVAYCAPEEFARALPYSMRIVGVDREGAATIKPYTASALIFGIPALATRGTMAIDVQSRLDALGIDVTQSKYTATIGYSAVTVLYYGQGRIQLPSEELARLPDEASCTAALSGVRDAFAEVEPAPLLTICTRHDLGLGYDIVNVTLGEPKLEANDSIETYETFAMCDADRARLTDYYRNDLGRPVLGSVCSNKTDDPIVMRGAWRVVMLERR